MGMLSFKWGPKKKKKNVKPREVKILFYQDMLRDANDLITKRLKTYDCFDVNVYTKILKDFYWLLDERNLTYRDPGFGDYEGKTTIVVGVQGADFEDHERRR